MSRYTEIASVVYYKIKHANGFQNIILIYNVMYIKAPWLMGKLCSGENAYISSGHISLTFDLATAQDECAAACDARVDCFHANLYFGTHADCYLRGQNCGVFQSHPNYYLYQKGKSNFIMCPMLSRYIKVLTNMTGFTNPF